MTGETGAGELHSKAAVPILDAALVRDLADANLMVEALRDAFARGCVMPVRHHHSITVPGEPEGTLLLMPAWQEGAQAGVKIATVFPGNATRGEPSVNATYLLFDARSGRPQALIDGDELTAQRTAATSVLAASYLARSDSEQLLIVGSGRIARYTALCYARMRPQLRGIAVWSRQEDKAAWLAKDLSAKTGLSVKSAPELPAAVREADIISCATLARDPLVFGAWLRPGTHLDLIGGFTPDMREADDAAVAGASLFADTRESAVREAGDFVQPLRRGIIAADAIVDLFALCGGSHQGRRDGSEITLFKSVGAALEDLAVAELLWQRASR
ncbi:MAG: ornithine cyclodeaminase family protein [Rhizomicrobium sp.]